MEMDSSNIANTNNESLVHALHKLDVYNLLDRNLSAKEIENIIKKQFHVLAFRFHPDRNLDPNKQEIAEKNFVAINESFQILNTALKDNFPLLLSCLPQEISQEEKIYRLYKTACKNYSSALENYFTKVKAVDLSGESAEYMELSSALKAIKEQFAWVIKSKPDNLWVSDSIEKISKINVWLEGQK